MAGRELGAVVLRLQVPGLNTTLRPVADGEVAVCPEASVSFGYTDKQPVVKRSSWRGTCGRQAPPTRNADPLALLATPQIFYWDASQFRPSVLQFLAPFAPSGNGSYIVAHENDLHVSYFPYDWARNGI